MISFIVFSRVAATLEEGCRDDTRQSDDHRGGCEYDEMQLPHYPSSNQKGRSGSLQAWQGGVDSGERSGGLVQKQTNQCCKGRKTSQAHCNPPQIT